MSFQENLKMLCKQKNMTQKELAKTCGLTERTISYYAQNKRLPKLENIKKIAAALNTTIDRLVG